MPEGFIAETNYLLDLILEQHDPSVQLFAAVKDGRAALFLPSVCIGEAIKSLERRISDWHSFESQLAQIADQMSRLSATRPLAQPFREQAAAVARLDDYFTRRLWSILVEVDEASTRLPFTGSTAMLAPWFAGVFDMSLMDAAVLATVVDARQECTTFISRDKRAFDHPAVKRYLKDRGMNVMSDPAQFISAHL